MVSLTQFADLMDKYAHNLDTNTDTVVKNVVRSIGQNLVTATPVDVGTACTNWRVGVGYIPEGVIPAFAPGTKGSTASANQHNAIDEIRRAVAHYTNGQSIDIVNNVPYLAKLNNGSSLQAPAGFVEEAFLKGLEQVKQVRNILTDIIREV